MQSPEFNWEAIMQRADLPAPSVDGRVTQVLGMLLEGEAYGAAVGDLYRVQGKTRRLRAEVVALRGERALLLPYGQLSGLEVGARLMRDGRSAGVAATPQLLGRVIDALGDPLDGGAPIRPETHVPLHRPPLSMLERRPITSRLCTGVRALDAFVPLGAGQRIGIFAGAGVGKSTLMSMLARHSRAHVVVLALVGERGREVTHFVQDVLGEKGLQRAVVVAATSDRPASERVRAAFAATSIAEYFRAAGNDVLLFVDSLTRFCMAQREVGLAVGEPPTSKGYPPSAFSLLPQLLERVAPAKKGGSISGVYTVLVEGDDLNDPVADTVRALLDGHIVLGRDLALRGHYPAVDVLQSLSRLESALLPPEELKAARRIRSWLAAAEDARDLISVGAYRPGTDARLDLALRKAPSIAAFLQQAESSPAALQETQQALFKLAQENS